MKKIISLAICLVLIISVLVLGRTEGEYFAGKGDKDGLEINSQEEFLALLNSASEIFEFVDCTDGIYDKGISVSLKQTAKQEGSSSKYSSMTICEEISSKTYTYINDKKGAVKSLNCFNGTITVYLDEGAVLIELDAIVYSSNDASRGEKSNDGINISASLYTDNENVYLKTDELYSTEFDNSKTGIVFGKWIDIGSGTFDGLDEILDVIESICIGTLKNTLVQYKNYLENNFDTAFERYENAYLLKKEYIGEFAKVLGEDFENAGKTTGSFLVDFSNDKNPETVREATVKCQKDKNKISYSNYMNLTFKNIGNTIVEIPREVLTVNEMEGNVNE